MWGGGGSGGVWMAGLTRPWQIMTDNLFNLDSLTINPSYDFINNLQSNDNNDFDIQSPYDLNTFDCSYSDLESFNLKFNNDPNVSILSLNIQSISSKYNELKEVIITMSKSGTSPDIICLQELWSFPQNANFSLPGYGKLIFKLRADDTQGGGGFLCQIHLKVFYI